MKTEDYDKLKKLCDENGFELLTESPNENDKFFVVKKKDIWDGLEYVECLGDCGLGTSIIKVTDNVKFDLIFRKNAMGSAFYDFFQPSTEQAYIEQLKKIAKEKFGEIKEGDRFDTGYGIHSILSNHPEWHYNKHIDFLYYKGLIVYSKGEWATKIPERVKVEWISTSCDEIRFYYKDVHHLNLVKLGPKMAETLETYLNDTNNNQD
jgi:hypothetical protein